MNPEGIPLNSYKAYQQHRAPAQTRIDTILSLYEALFERLEKARAALGRQDQAEAKKQLAACQLGVGTLASAFDARAGELAFNLFRLYEFVGRCLASADETQLEAAMKVLRTLYEGFLEIRPEAVRKERAGVIPALDQISTVQASA
jgi:flagellin-specific chaperone FliS